MDPFIELEQELETYLSHDQITQVKSAYLIAAKAHAGQKRYTGEDYIHHPVAVARILAKMHMDDATIMAALLHDVLEDTHVDKNTLLKKFGEEVAELVDGVSKLTQIQFESRAEAQAENFRKMLLAMAQDIRVIIIKLADRLHNMRTLSGLPPTKRRRVAKETLEIFSPIANRLGMHKFLVEFEDLGFEALHPLRYRVLKKVLRKTRGRRKEMMEKIAKTINDRLEEHGIVAHSVIGRKKHLYSIYKKMHSKHLSFSEIMDVYAFRVIVDDVDTCYRTLGAVHQLFKPLPERFKDYIAMPKANNYQSLHTTLFGPYGLPIEIQIRTKEMNRTAQNGIAAHWLYKSEPKRRDETQVRTRAWLEDLLEMQESTKSPLEFIENVKTGLFPDEVYVFTPKGDILELPAGATPIDFAYAVHSDIGNSCIAAKVNRRIMPLSAVLSNGQTVEIITAPGARPNPSWQNFVVTGKAKSNIRQFMKEQRRIESIALGKELFDKTASVFLKSTGKLTPDQIQALLKFYKYKTLEDLYEAIGLGNQLPIAFARTLTKQFTESADKTEIIPLDLSKKPLLIKGSQGLIVSFAPCCRPIPGDPIIGAFKIGQGLLIHSEQCKGAVLLRRHPERCIAVQWEENLEGEFKVDVQVEVANQRGVLAKLSSAIAGADANIEDIVITTHNGGFMQIKFTVSVRDRAHLARTMRRMRSIKEVTKVIRVK